MDSWQCTIATPFKYVKFSISFLDHHKDVDGFSYLENAERCFDAVKSLIHFLMHTLSEFMTYVDLRSFIRLITSALRLRFSTL